MIVGTRDRFLKLGYWRCAICQREAAVLYVRIGNPRVALGACGSHRESVKKMLKEGSSGMEVIYDQQVVSNLLGGSTSERHAVVAFWWD